MPFNGGNIPRLWDGRIFLLLRHLEESKDGDDGALKLFLEPSIPAILPVLGEGGNRPNGRSIRLLAVPRSRWI